MSKTSVDCPTLKNTFAKDQRFQTYLPSQDSKAASRGERVSSNFRSSRPAGHSSSASLAKAATFHWVRGELIAKRSYNRVYLTLNAKNGELMAVKQVETPQTASDRAESRQMELVKALKLESKTLKDLEHPNIVQNTFLAELLEAVF
ncbi:hypothetical protein B0H10DRAFT_1945206 [Mycena sp. CBHHK59/15]|nr:hypothetical protein B0H10DRAFT_1945206 [Mycena sp. CBHHK59/15]